MIELHTQSDNSLAGKIFKDEPCSRPVTPRVASAAGARSRDVDRPLGVSLGRVKQRFVEADALAS